MKKSGYEISEQDIEKTLNYLRKTVDENATRDDAIAYLQEHQSMAHIVAHEIVEDEELAEKRTKLSENTTLD
ncbi:hypothetical protein GW797_00625 [Candidatus Parcubacteria bacterium]|nr:hypothetical protein [Candidatus Parcubacteria bacterium]